MKTSSGKTAFQLAIENNKCEVVEYLMNLGADILSQPFANKRYNPRVGIFFKDKSMLCITIGTWDQDTALCDGGNKSRCAWLRKFKLLRKLKTCSFYYFVISLPSFTFTGPPQILLHLTELTSQNSKHLDTKYTGVTFVTYCTSVDVQWNIGFQLSYLLE